MAKVRAGRITVAAAAARVGVTAQTIRTYIANGRLTGYRVGPKLLQLDEGEVERLVQARS